MVSKGSVSQSTGLYRHSLVFQRLENFLAQMPLKKFKWPEPFVYQSALTGNYLFVCSVDFHHYTQSWIEPDYVAKEVVAATLRDEEILLIPRALAVNFFLTG